MGKFPAALYSELVKDLRTALGADLGDFVVKNPGLMWPGISPFQAACTSIARSLPRKWEVKDDKLNDKAWDKFVACNTACGNWEPLEVTPLDSILLGEFRDELSKFWWNGERINHLLSEPIDLLKRGRLGPGSNVGGRGGDFYTKLFSSPLTGTDPFLYFWYKHYTASLPSWGYGEILRTFEYGQFRVVSSNRLTFVPKNDSTSRTICSEPTLNMFYQLGFGNILEDRLLDRYGIDLTVQQFKNRELARLGSIDGSVATIDLESASDTISRKMLKEFLPPGFYQVLERYRCASTESDRGKLDLNMISTMGNGYTFALQTVLFTCAVVACLKVSGIKPIYPRGRECGNFGVNGDDIIIPVRPDLGLCPTRLVTRLLTLLGFRINGDKSFVEGPFRESCGADFFRGRNIRGVYIKRLEVQQDYFSAINQLNLFSTRTGVLLPHTVQWLLNRCSFTMVPRWENDDSGIKVPYSMLRNPRIDRNTGSTLYYKYEPLGQKIRIGDSALFVPRSLKRRMWNPHGLHTSFLQGGIEDHTIGARQRRRRYVRRVGVAPSWDAIQCSNWTTSEDAVPAVQPIAGWFNWRRWETSVYRNLFG
jgi:hypothetical protein